MKQSVIVFLVLLFFGYSCEKPSDCVSSSGDFITKVFEVQPFSRIKVYKGIEVIITQGDEYKIEVVAGENFIDNIEVIQRGDQLIFRDNTSCNWVRNYGQTKVFVTAPDLKEIYSKTDRNIRSNGVLSFYELSILALDKDGDGETGAGTGDFILELNTQLFSIHNNNVSRFYLSGQTNNASYNFYFGDGRLEAQNLEAQYMQVYHRGSNDMIVKPIQKVEGKLVSTGDLVLKNVPPTVMVEELYNGRIIYP